MGVLKILVGATFLSLLTLGTPYVVKAYHKAGHDGGPPPHARVGGQGQGQGAHNKLPEPSTLWLLGSGLAGLAAWQWRRSRMSKD